METCFLMQVSDILPVARRGSGADQVTELTKQCGQRLGGAASNLLKQMDSTWSGVKASSTTTSNTAIFLNKSELAIYIGANQATLFLI